MSTVEEKEIPITLKSIEIQEILEHSRMRILRPETYFKRKIVIGTKLWVKETYSPIYWKNNFDEYVYRVDKQWDNSHIMWSSSVTMPKKACRIKLEVIDINIVPMSMIIETLAEGYDISREKLCDIFKKFDELSEMCGIRKQKNEFFWQRKTPMTMISVIKI
jgi:hypothetical protein